ncbi:MAG: hypothetical protein ABIW31_01670 [Novosphingobium sp.]
MRSMITPLAIAMLALVPLSARADAPSNKAVVAGVAAPVVDPVFTEPYVDIDEWRTTPLRHRYVHGGFKGTDTRFSFYFPLQERYKGHFFQHVTPVPGSENEEQRMPTGSFNKIGFSIDSGAYFVETNEGGHLDLGKGDGNRQSDPTIISYRADAASAQYSRVVAQKMYGAKRPYGYVYGGSGGAFHTIAGFENTRGVWDGAVPYVVGSTMAIPNMFTIRIRAMRILSDKFPQILDAIEPGGSGDPYAGLTPDQADVLREATRMGFPMRSWFGYKTMGIHGLSALYPIIKMVDAPYFTEFWTKPGYLGFDHPEQFTNARLQFKSTIGGLLTGADAAALKLNTDASSNRPAGGVDNAFRSALDRDKVIGLRLAETPPKVDFLGGDLIVLSGAAKGKLIPVARIDGNVVVLGVADSDVVAKLVPADEVQIDNSNFLALETYHWHQVPGPDFKVWDQFRGPDGKPLYPQRSFLMGPAFMKNSFGPMETGVFEGKMIIMASLWDREAMPWQADWYRQRIAAHFGAAADDHVRLWYTDYAQHGDGPEIEDPTRTVTYNGELQQALRDISAWVEHGVTPAASTAYRIADGQVIMPPTAAARKGIQPVVSLKANGGARADVATGQQVTFTGLITVPPGGGSVVAAEWNFGGGPSFTATTDIPANARTASVKITHRFDRPGTYFAVLRGTAQRSGNRSTPYARLQNIDRVRVVVK